MPGNDVRRSHSSVRTTIKQCSGNPQQLLSKCQHQPRQQSLKATKLKDFVLCLSRPHFPQALSGTWQQPAVSPAPLPTPTPSLPPSLPTKRLGKQYIGPGNPTLECPLVATLGTSPIYLEIRCSALRGLLASLECEAGRKAWGEGLTFSKPKGTPGGSWLRRAETCGSRFQKVHLHITQTAAATSRCFRSGSKAHLGPFRGMSEVLKSLDYPHCRMRMPSTEEMICPRLVASLPECSPLPACLNTHHVCWIKSFWLGLDLPSLARNSCLRNIRAILIRHDSALL
ncbi:uncharacterized protein LOC107196272 isoform X2 [Pteropus alecto]|uniref:uncharacterized protein LOC107196272 isoform X2 n=1 Tax=Pteropus alecto TaxID=9402 RepID=UPI0007684FD8|nr:uncharacterized protein LOC107196272 isoform X2 [Pteropus alecto]